MKDPKQKEELPDTFDVEDDGDPDLFSPDAEDQGDEGEDYGNPDEGEADEELVVEEDTEEEDEEDETPADPEEEPLEELKDKLPRAAYLKIKAARTKRTEAQTEAMAARQESADLKARLDAQAAEIEALKDPEPDFDDEPAKWKDWSTRDTARKVAAAGKVATPAAGADPRRDQVIRQREEARKAHPDYDRFVNPAVQARISNDPLLYDRVWGPNATNPAIEAYKIGKELFGMSDKKARPKGSGGSGNGYVAPRGGVARTGALTRLSPDQQKIARQLGLSDTALLASLNKEQRRA